ncbi:MAG: cyclic nucleotide-binding domain-containing protein [Ilumatobacteraceae bacterium]
MAYESLLASTDFFAGADSETLEKVTASAQERKLVRGDVLFNEGDEPDSLFVVIRGRIAIANQSFDKRRASTPSWKRVTCSARCRCSTG